MTIREVKRLQEQYEVDYYQEIIDSGLAWKMEGSVGRKCMEYLSAGVCYLPLTTYYDYWGNEVPSRTKVADGTRGSLSLAKEFWGDEVRYEDYFDFEKQLYNE